MSGIYRQRHSERTVFYRVLFHYFERFVGEYEDRFEKEYGYFRAVIQEVVEKYLDCGNPMCGFARIRCSDCGEERLLMFSCKTRGFCPSCHAKRREEWGVDETEGKLRYQYSKDGSQEESMDYLEFIARVTSHIPDKGQVMIRYHGASTPMPIGGRCVRLGQILLIPPSLKTTRLTCLPKVGQR